MNVNLSDQLRELVTLYTRGQRRELLQLHLPPHVRLLAVLRRLAPIAQGQFARAIGFDKSWTSRLLDHFVRDGLVERVPLAGDRRCLELHLTKAGLDEAQRIERVLDDYARRQIDRIPAEAQAKVGAALALLVAALQAQDPAAGGRDGDR